MKKINYVFITALAWIAITTLPAYAATTASITPQTINVAAGQHFNVVVAVNPTVSGDYAEKVVVNFPANLLEVTSYSQGGGWIALSQPGYDLTDNSAGTLIKSAGYPGGIISSTPFGTITFVAKKSGIGTISIGSGSQSFQKNSQTAMIGKGASVKIAAAPALLKNTDTSKTTSISNSNDLTPVASVNGQTVATTSLNPVSAAQAAAAASAVSSWHTIMTVIWTIIVIAILAGIGYFIVLKRKK